MSTSVTPAQILASLSPSPDPKGGAALPAWYGMVILGLASQAYTAQGGSDWPTMQSALFRAITTPKYTPALPLPKGAEVAAGGADALPGAWSLDWGPANGQDGDGDNSNLIYIASYRAQGNPNYADGAPYFFVVSIRGTDVSVKGPPLYQQLFQDIRDFELHSWPKLLKDGINTLLHGHLSVPTPNTRDPAGLDGHIADGSMRGFVKIANSTAPLNDGKTPVNGGAAFAVVAALNNLTRNYRGAPIVVTGHSLGAAQAQVMASYLAWQFQGQTVIPFLYAPPTAGDADFMATYMRQCPSGQFWYNDHDVVPYAYITLPAADGSKPESGLAWAAKNLWSAYQWPPEPPPAKPAAAPSLPLPMIALIDTLGKLIPPVYERPAGGILPLKGNIPAPATIAALLASMGGGMAKMHPDSGIAQLVWQHFPPCYAELMTAQYGDQLAPFRFAAYKPEPLA
ncbi:MAG TPA: hypothetical protein VNU97_03200 [Rhizomicrobium sp.]|nr:hypothetical protein [Rhizomicrobium sp.]